MNKKGTPENLKPREKKYTDKVIKEIHKKLKAYIEETPIPILAEFAYKNGIPRQQMYKFESMSDTIKMLRDKKEAQLEKLGLFGKINTTMAVFSLKQLGWKDKQEVDLNGTLDIPGLTIKGYGKK